VPQCEPMTISLTDKQWEEIDSRIRSRTILLALIEIRKAANVGLSEAQDILYGRYATLRNERPDEFTCTDAEYWKGFYS
jgi:hypothetical protein